MQTYGCHHVPEVLFQPLMPERRTLSVAVVKMVDDNADMEESAEVKKERNEMQEYLILSFVDWTGTANSTTDVEKGCSAKCTE
jgi:hypothetical protein